MAQASALLIPSPSQTGILTLQDPARSNPIQGLIDLGPNSFSPGPGGLNSGGAGGPSLNFFPPQPPASISTSPRQQTGPQVNFGWYFLSTVKLFRRLDTLTKNTVSDGNVDLFEAETRNNIKACQHYFPQEQEPTALALVILHTVFH